MKQNSYGFTNEYDSYLAQFTLGAYPEARPVCQIVNLKNATNPIFGCERKEEIIVGIIDSGMIDNNN